MLASLTLGSIGTSVDLGSLVVWALLALWTASTSRYVWSRLEWLRTLPWPFRAETAILVGLLFAGFGTREWHVVHSAIPLVFCAFFVSVRAAAIVAAALTIALWATKLPPLLGWSSPIESPLGPATPSAAYIVTAVTLLFVRLLFADIRRLAAAERATERSLRNARLTTLARQTLLDTTQQASQAVRDLLTGIGAEAQIAVKTVGADLATRAAEFIAACRASELTLERLTRNEPLHTSSVLAEVEALVREFESLTLVSTTIERRCVRDVLLDATAVAPFRRLVREALINAHKHGRPPILVVVDCEDRAHIEIRNASTQRVRHLPGHRGLDSMHADAEALGAQLRFTHANATVSVGVELPNPPPKQGEAEPPSASFAHTLSQRRSAFTFAMHAGRLGLALVALAVVLFTPSNYRPHLALFLATAVLVIAWNAALIAARHPVATTLRRHPRLFWIEGTGLVALNLLLGGLLSPWYGLTIAAVMPAALYGDATQTLLYATTLASALLGGDLLAHLLGPHLPTNSVVLPQDFLLACLTLALACAIFMSVRRTLDQLAEAISAHERMAIALAAEERQAADVAGHAEAQRELHDFLFQDVLQATHAHALLTDETPDNETLAATGVKLDNACALLRQILDSLGHGTLPDNRDR